MQECSTNNINTVQLYVQKKKNQIKAIYYEDTGNKNTLILYIFLLCFHTKKNKKTLINKNTMIYAVTTAYIPIFHLKFERKKIKIFHINSCGSHNNIYYLFFLVSLIVCPLSQISTASLTFLLSFPPFSLQNKFHFFLSFFVTLNSSGLYNPFSHSQLQPFFYASSLLSSEPIDCIQSNNQGLSFSFSLTWIDFEAISTSLYPLIAFTVSNLLHFFEFIIFFFLFL